MKQAVLLASFGTSVPEAFENEILPVLEALKEAAAPRSVYMAFTSPTIRRIWSGRGRALHSVAETLEQMGRDGVEEVFLQPTHLIFGYEYDKLKAEAAVFRGRFRSIQVGRPLLNGSGDLMPAARLMAARYPAQAGQAIVLLGHGTTHTADMLYPALQTAFRALGRGDILVGTVEGWPGFGELLAQACAGGFARVLLAPFLLVAGEHARHDMGGKGPDSWASRFQAAGFEVDCRFAGLGRFEEFRALYVHHLKTLLGE